MVRGEKNDEKKLAVLLCLLAWICGTAAAEENRRVLDFPKSGFTFTVPDCVENLAGRIFSIHDFGETGYGSGILYANALNVPRTDEEAAAMNELLQSSDNPADPIANQKVFTRPGEKCVK